MRRFVLSLATFITFLVTVSDSNADLVYTFDHSFVDIGSPTEQIRLQGTFSVSETGFIQAGPLNGSTFGSPIVTGYEMVASAINGQESTIIRSFSGIPLALSLSGAASIEATESALIFHVPEGLGNE
ncbi:MAG: hypothetical protein AAGA30_07750, partial [Planctomycetota bacterium]